MVVANGLDNLCRLCTKLCMYITEQGRSRDLHLVVPLMIMVKLMSINAMLIPTLLGVAAIKKFIIFTFMVLPTFLQKLKACKIIPHLVHYSPHHTYSHEFHDDHSPYYASYPRHLHRRMGQYKSINLWQFEWLFKLQYGYTKETCWHTQVLRMDLRSTPFSYYNLQLDVCKETSVLLFAYFACICNNFY